ncbi:MAG: DUF1566 domain-containing protein, partial [Desulfobacteraceae bacterium]|nr:DUF1566 domain-containing protein [Desulfobacteraceae bacterium]
PLISKENASFGLFITITFCLFSLLSHPAAGQSTTKAAGAKIFLDKKPKYLLWDDFYTLVLKHNFFYAGKNDTGDFPNQFKLMGDGAILDRTSGLMWQKTGSNTYMDIKAALKYVDRLNNEKYMGYSDWRLPSLEELFSILENKKQGRMYIDPLFGPKQIFCWSNNMSIMGYHWGILFTEGIAYNYQDTFYVKAVRSIGD